MGGARAGVRDHEARIMTWKRRRGTDSPVIGFFQFVVMDVESRGRNSGSRIPAIEFFPHKFRRSNV